MSEQHANYYHIVCTLLTCNKLLIINNTPCSCSYKATEVIWNICSAALQRTSKANELAIYFILVYFISVVLYTLLTTQLWRTWLIDKRDDHEQSSADYPPAVAGVDSELGMGDGSTVQQDHSVAIELLLRKLTELERRVTAVGQVF